MKRFSKPNGCYAIILTAIFCCAAMAVVDGIIQPHYAIKSGIKIAVFFLLPLLITRIDKCIIFLPLLKPKRKGFLFALGLGVGLYALLLGAYFILGPYFDFSSIAGSLTNNTGITKENFLYVSLYISFVNSFLEEFFFRGFIFKNLNNKNSKVIAYLFSASIFALYHVAMMIGWFSPALFVIVMIGLFAGGIIFNWLNEKLDTIYCSWLTHMFANFAINTIGFLLLK